MLQKNRKTVFFALLAAGALLMVLGRFFAPDTTRDEPHPTYHAQSQPYATLAQDTDTRATEARLGDFFSMVDGAGRVQVMLGVASRRETVFAVDTSSSETFTREEDAQGGTRETRAVGDSQQTVLIPDRNGTGRPLILHETEPSYTGIVIIAEGGDDPQVRTALTRAAQAVLGIDAHRIQVLTMQRN